VTLNPARLARFADWAQTLPPRPLPRTAIPVPGEYYLDYTVRLAGANHLELPELTGALDDPAAVTLDPGQRKQHRQERLAAAAGQPLARIARLCWDDHGDHLRDPGGFRQLLRRPAAAAPPAWASPGPSPAACRRTRPSAATGSGPARPHAPTPPSSTPASSPRSSRRSAATTLSCTTTPGRTSRPPSATPPTPSTRPCAAAPGSRASGSGCTSSPPAPGPGPSPGCSAAALAGQTTAPPTPSSRSRYTPTSSGSPHASSGSTAPATRRVLTHRCPVSAGGADSHCACRWPGESQQERLMSRSVRLRGGKVNRHRRICALPLSGRPQG